MYAKDRNDCLGIGQNIHNNNFSSFIFQLLQKLNERVNHSSTMPTNFVCDTKFDYNDHYTYHPFPMR